MLHRCCVYLFEGGPEWNGSEFCATSKTVSTDTSLASGLKLGIAPERVKSILGDPNIATADQLIYYFGYKRKTRGEELARFRSEHTDMTDAEFRENFEYGDGEVYIETRFVSGKLKYLAVS